METLKLVRIEMKGKEMTEETKTFTRLADFFVDVNSRRTPYPSMSRGMFFFLELEVHYPDIAEEIRGTKYDPSYADSVLTDFVIRVMELYFEDQYKNKNT